MQKSFLSFILLLLFVIGLAGCQNRTGNYQKDGFNRIPRSVHYSKHARCRMDCRNINEQEIMDVIRHGSINYKKSELNTDNAHKRYAIEALENNVRLRIVVAESGSDATVITCIDLDNEWSCDCPGDELKHR
jgi:hypothetical protein